MEKGRLTPPNPEGIGGRFHVSKMFFFTHFCAFDAVLYGTGTGYGSPNLYLYSKVPYGTGTVPVKVRYGTGTVKYGTVRRIDLISCLSSFPVFCPTVPYRYGTVPYRIKLVDDRTVRYRTVGV